MNILQIKSIIPNEQLKASFLKHYENEQHFRQLVDEMIEANFDFRRLPDFSNVLHKYFQSLNLCSDKTKSCEQENKGFRFILKFDNSQLFLLLKPCLHRNNISSFASACVIADFPQKWLQQDLKSQLKNLMNKERNNLLKYQKNLLTNFVDVKPWLVLTGNFGTGKTFLSVFFAQSFASKCQGQIIFINATNLFGKFFQRKREDPEFERFFHTLKTIDLLIIDDFGTENRSLQFRDDFLLPLFQYRFNHSLSTFIISNFPYGDLKKSYTFTNTKTEIIKLETFFNLWQKGAQFLTLTQIFKE